MDKKTWKKIESIYDAAMALNENSRDKFVQKNTDGNREVYEQVTKMLESNNNEFMEEFPGSVSSIDDLINPEMKALGHFNILKKVATGGMGRVYLAQSKNSDVKNVVALKTIRIELVNKDLEKKFHNEKLILSKLKHKNIANLIDAGVTVNKIPYIATEWVDGQNIINYCRDQKLSIKVRLKLFQQICSAVSFAHNKLIIHRDLKPDNILIDKHGEVKLLDFGIAKIIDENQNDKTQTQIYTPEYAAPEQINAEFCTVATDVYSLGVILFEILTNSKRFDLSDLALSEKIKTICSPKPIDIHSIKSELPYPVTHVDAALLTIIKKAMHVEQNRRYESVTSLTSDIDNYLNNRPISAMKDSFFYKLKMFILRNRLASFLTSLFLVAVLTGIYVNNKQVNMKLQEAEKSEVMLSFFQGILKSASPSQGGSTNLTVRKMFELGIDKYNLNLIKDPYIKAELTAQIGQIYGDLDIHDEMLKYTEVASNYYQSNLNNDKNASAFINLSNAIAFTYMSRNNYDKALEYLDQAHSEVKEFNINPKQLSRSYTYYGEIYFDKDKSKSMQYLNTAEKLANVNNLYEEVALVNYNKFNLFYDSNSDEDAFKYLDKAQLYFEKDNQTELNIGLMETLSARADLQSKIGLLDAAELTYEKVALLSEQTFGNAGYNSTSNRINNLNKKGDFAAASAQIKVADKIFEDNHLEKNTDYHYLIYMKAITWVEFQRFEEVENLLDIVSVYYSKILPAKHRIFKILKMRQAEYYLKSGQRTKIKLMQSELVEFLKTDLSQSIKRWALFNLGNTSLYLEEYTLAEHYFLQAYSLLKQERGEQDYFYWQLLTGFELSKVKQGKLDHIENFNKAKNGLLSKVSINPWYDKFYSLD